MKKEISRGEAMKLIDEFFSKDDFSAGEMKKIKKLSMKFRIRLGERRKNFCKKCLMKLKGRIRIKGDCKVVECASCGYLNRIKIHERTC